MKRIFCLITLWLITSKAFSADNNYAHMEELSRKMTNVVLSDETQGLEDDMDALLIEVDTYRGCKEEERAGESAVEEGAYQQLLNHHYQEEQQLHQHYQEQEVFPDRDRIEHDLMQLREIQRREQQLLLYRSGLGFPEGVKERAAATYVVGRLAA